MKLNYLYAGSNNLTLKKFLAELALEYRLYSRGAGLEFEWRDKRKDPSSDKDDIILVVDQFYPIAAAIRFKDSSRIWLFVKQDYRRKGVGTQIVAEFKKRKKRVMGHGSGLAGSIEFFKACNLRTY